MVRIYIRKCGEAVGHVFKSHSSIKNDKVAILPWIGFVNKGLISEDEWFKSQQSICEKFGLYITERKVDGRNKLTKSMRFFSWSQALA